MNYLKIYEKIIFNAKTETRKKLKKTNIKYIYYEKHHIIPRCINGTDEKENLVLLTGKEHYVCHKLLTYVYKENRKIACAFHRMTFDKSGRCNISSRDYAYAKFLKATIPISEETRQKMRDSSKEYTKSTEYRNNMSILCSGEKNGMFGKKHSIKTKQKLKINHRGGVKNHTEETKKKMSELKMGVKNSMFGVTPWNKGRKNVYSKETIEKMKKPKSEEHKKKLRKPKSEEHKQKLRKPHNQSWLYNKELNVSILVNKNNLQEYLDIGYIPGRIISKEQKIKQSNAMKGKIPWNKKLNTD